MAQVVPAEVGDPGSLEDFFPRRLKSGGDIKETRSGSGLLAPAPQHAHGFVIERHMPGLAILGIPALDGEKPAVEVHGTPTQLDHLAAPQPAIVDLEGLCAGLNQPTRKELRSDEGLHVHFSSKWELDAEPQSACAYKRKECRSLKDQGVATRWYSYTGTSQNLIGAVASIRRGIWSCCGCFVD